MQSKLQSLIRSRRFWAAISGLIVIIAQDMGIADLNPDSVQNIVFLIISWITSESIRSSEGAKS